MADKIDFKTTAAYRARRDKIEIIEVPGAHYLMVDGHGDPNTSRQFSEAVEALYPVAYKMKFASKRDLGRDYVVPPLEGLWRAEDMEAFTTQRDKSQWDWTLMLMVPEWLDHGSFAAAVEQAAVQNVPGRLGDVRLESLSEGQSVQTLHVGSYDDEAGILHKMHHEFIPEHGFRMVGTHHEIYLSDPRKVAADKRRTILRQPVAPLKD